MTHILLYWNHICVLHRQEKAFLEQLTETLRASDIELEVRYFGLGYPEHMSDYLARPDAKLPDLIVSADLEVFDDVRIFGKFKDTLYPCADWMPLRAGSALDAVTRDPYLLPFVSIPLVYYTRNPEAANTALTDCDGLAFGGINNSAVKTVAKVVWEHAGGSAARSLLERSVIADMPIGAFQAVRQNQAQTALVPSIYALRADGKNTFLCTPQEGPILIPSYLCARTSAPEWALRQVTEGILCKELAEFYVKNGDLIVYPDVTNLHCKQEGGAVCYPSAKWLTELSPETFYEMYCAALPTAHDPVTKTDPT